MKIKGLAIILLILLILVLAGIWIIQAQAIPAYTEVLPTATVEPVKATPVPTPQETTVKETAIEIPKLKFIAVGDIMLGRRVGKKLETAGDYKLAFSNVEGTLKQGDVIFANLESPLTASTHSLNKAGKIVLKGSPAAMEAITFGGFNLMSISNNHMLDYYDTGLFDTISLLDKNGIAHSGAGKNSEEAGKPAIIEKNGYKIGLLSYTDMANYIFDGEPRISFAAGKDKAGVIPRDYDTIRQAVTELRGKVDLLAVSLHWGIEESFTIPPEQVDFARKLLDDGADMILGHHPHQFQGMEIYKGKPIIYSMGNFLFDQNDPENMETFIIEMQYEGETMKSLTAKPVRIVDKSRAELQSGEAAKSILEREAGLCTKLGTTPVIEGDTLVFRPEGQ